MPATDLSELYHALHRLNRQMHRSAHRQDCGKRGLYHGQANLLLLIRQNDGASQRDLAEQLDVRPSSMTEMLTRLEQNELVERKQDDQDQRVMRIYLTEKGRQAAQEMADSKDTFAASFFQALNEDEQAQLKALIEKLCSGLEADEDAYSERMEGGHGTGHQGGHHQHGCCGDNGWHHGHGHHAHHCWESHISENE